jgi:hypothetical protein
MLCHVEDRNREPPRSDDERFPIYQLAKCAYELVDRPAIKVTMLLVTVCSTGELAR